LSATLADGGSARALIESNAREAADLVGELTLLLDRVGNENAYLSAARMVTRRLADRLGQVMTLERLARAGGLRPDTWSPIEVVEELEHEAISLAGERIEVRVHAPELVPQYWFFDRELVTLALSNALHNALIYARQGIGLEFGLKDGYLGFSVLDDGGAFPAELLAEGPPRLERGDCNGNALGIYFARLIAAAHVNAGRSGWVELVNRSGTSGTRFTLWLP
jgi:signal transduction histidine kinase